MLSKCNQIFFSVFFQQVTRNELIRCSIMDINEFLEMYDVMLVKKKKKTLSMTFKNKP